MTTRTDTAIWLALKTRIDAMQLADEKGNVYAIAWPGIPFTIPVDRAYLRVAKIAAPPQRIFIKGGQAHDRAGKLIITIAHPANQAMSAVYEDLAARIAEHFKDGTHMRFEHVCVQVTSAPHVQEGYLDGAYWHKPVFISWGCSA